MAFSAQTLLLNTPTSASLTPTKPKTQNTTTHGLAAFPLSQKRPVLRKTNVTYTTRCCSVSPPSQMPRHPEYIPNRIPDDCYVRVMDTTLRDGEQAPGAAMTRDEKIAIARQLAKLGVDVIEAGFPASSKEDLETSRQIAIEVGNDVDEFGWVPTICACCRCVRSDVEAAWEAVRHARRPRVNIFISTSEIHMKYKLNKTAEEVLKLAKESVTYARSLGAKDIEFICEDAGRSQKEFLYRIYGEAIKAGATTITFTDTVGYNFPNEVDQMIKDLKANVQGIQNVIIAVHCHNDLGLANANTIAAAHAGARQIEVTINGIGERAGNASLEEFVMAVKARGKDILGGLHTGINTKHIVTASKMVEEYSGLSIQPHKAIVGANVFSHASGIHQDGMLKNKSTYEIISPEDIGFCHSNETGIVLGKHSGRHALKSRLLQIGHDLDEKKLDVVFRHFKALAETKKCVTNEDIESLVSQYVQPDAVAI